jgi:pSer/pThr/pTyr-binding forkhead associated (FHA) protein
MPSKITLTITQGPYPGREYIFDSRTTCIVGRSPDCNPQLPNDTEHLTISRYHCLLDINPPNIRVRDFGSLNGTYVNGNKIGQRESYQTPQEGKKLKFQEHDLQAGDEIQLGNTVFKVGIDVDQTEVKNPHIISSQQQDEKVVYSEAIKRLLTASEQGEETLQVISGYKIVKLLSKDQFGEVYLVKHYPTGKYVALKIMIPMVIGKERELHTFLRDLANTQSLQHFHIMQLFDYGLYDDIFFLTMEYCEGGSVGDLMYKSGGKLPIDLSVDIALQVLDGLIYAHSAEVPWVKLPNGTFGQGKGLIHRDLKPSNIFLTFVDDSRVAKIGDYGLTKAFDSAGLSGQTLTGNAARSPVFMPRQQVLDFNYAQPGVDVWAAAACLYNMITGEFPRDFSGDQFLAVLQNNPISIRLRDRTVPRELADVIDSALVEKPDIHFKSAVNFKKALLSVT